MPKSKGGRCSIASNRPGVIDLGGEVSAWGVRCEESCVARYRHVHLSLDFTSQEFGIEPNVSTTIQSSSSVAIQNRGYVCLSTGGEVLTWGLVIDCCFKMGCTNHLYTPLRIVKGCYSAGRTWSTLQDLNSRTLLSALPFYFST